MTLVIDCYTSNQAAYKAAPIAKSNKCVPEWFKRIPAKEPAPVGSIAPNRSIKHCMGITDLYQQGFMIPAWEDMMFNFDNGEFGYQICGQDCVQLHHPDQRRGYLQNHIHFKIQSPWFVKANKDIDFLMLWPTWEYATDIGMFGLPGVLKLHHIPLTHINIMANQHFDRIVEITTGTPLCQIIPLTQEPYEINLHISTDEEIQKITTPQAHLGRFVQGGMKYIKSMLAP
jgi:hypothetical protein